MELWWASVTGPGYLLAVYILRYSLNQLVPELRRSTFNTNFNIVVGILRFTLNVYRDKDNVINIDRSKTKLNTT